LADEVFLVFFLVLQFFVDFIGFFKVKELRKSRFGL